MASKYEYVDKSGALRSVDASSEAEARSLAKDISPTSGFAISAIAAPKSSPKTNPTTPPSVPPSPQDEFLTTLQDRLLNQSSLISSGRTALEGKIAEAIRGVQGSADANAARINSLFNRQIDFQSGQAVQERTGVQEVRSGFATNAALLRHMDERTEKSLRDLEQRKQELILAGDAEAAGKIADLQMKEIEFKIEAEQQAFSNMLQVGTFALQKNAQEQAVKQFNQTFNLQKDQFAYQQRADMAELAAQWGVDIMPGDDLSSIVAKVKPLVLEDRALDHAAKRAEIARLNRVATESTKTANNIRAQGLLRDAIAGRGAFEKDGPMGAEAAAVAVANYLANNVGIEVSKEDYNNLVQQAVDLGSQYETASAKATAEQQGKSLFNFFGSTPNAVRSNPINFNYTSLPQSFIDRQNSAGKALFTL